MNMQRSVHIPDLKPTQQGMERSNMNNAVTPDKETTEQVQRTEYAMALLKNPILLRREINNRSLYEFIKYFWDEVSSDEYIDNWHVPMLCKELERVAVRVGNNEPKEYDLVINVPPGMTKTIVCSIMFPIWCWSKWPWMRFICASYAGALAMENADYSRNLLKSDKFKLIYPEYGVKDDKDTKSNFRLIIKKQGASPGRIPLSQPGGNRFSTSVTGTATGYHAHIQIIDDPLNPKQAVSELELRKANHFCDQTLSTRKTNKKVTAMILIMQRLHQDDPSGHLLAKKGKKIRHVCLPGEIKNYSQYVNPPELIDQYQGQLLDRNRLGWNELSELMADLGQYGYAGQIGQNPTPPGGGMFQVAHFQIATKMPNTSHILHTVRYWDKAATSGAGAYTTGVKISKLINGFWLIEDVKRGQWSTEERERIIRETAQTDGPFVHVLVEQEPGSGGKESAENTIRNLAGFVVYADTPVGNKVFRADPYSVQVNNGNVSLLSGEWNHLYVEEHRFFPFGTYKDQVDASSAGFNYLCRKKIVRRLT